PFRVLLRILSPDGYRDEGSLHPESIRGWSWEDPARSGSSPCPSGFSSRDPSRPEGRGSPEAAGSWEGPAPMSIGEGQGS
ncbi:MAG: hypothetical protein QME51_05425, partial [Planctomycetota bacterium]|nr:hypothetical protein [Planctomycetota bacterium]